MFHVMWNYDLSETTMLKNVTVELERRLPRDWSLSLSKEDRLFPGKAYVDAVLEIDAPDGTSATILVEVKRKTLEARDIIPQILSWRNAFLNRAPTPLNNEVNIMVISAYLGQAARDELAKEGISFADMTGNIRFALRRPAVFIEARGANKNPLRENVPLKTLRGRGAGRAVRGLLDYRPPFGIRELSSVIKSSAASL